MDGTYCEWACLFQGDAYGLLRSFIVLHFGDIDSVVCDDRWEEKIRDKEKKSWNQTKKKKKK